MTGQNELERINAIMKRIIGFAFSVIHALGTEGHL